MYKCIGITNIRMSCKVASGAAGTACKACNDAVSLAFHCNMTYSCVSTGLQCWPMLLKCYLEGLSNKGAPHCFDLPCHDIWCYVLQPVHVYFVADSHTYTSLHSSGLHTSKHRAF